MAEQHPSYVGPVSPQKALTLAAEPGAAPDPVQQAERGFIAQRRQSAWVRRRDADAVAGLAISGGGVRSATFSLGLVQALAKADLLRHFDYLSTVSGGGYLGSSLLWWWSGLAGNRRPFGVTAANFPYGVDPPHNPLPPQDQEDQQQTLRFLRQRGEYLTPGHAFTLAAGVGAVVRGMVLNISVLLVFLVTLLISLEWVAHHTAGSYQGVWEVYCGVMDALEPGQATATDVTPQYTVAAEGSSVVLLSGAPPDWKQSPLRKQLVARLSDEVAPACTAKPPVPVLYALLIAAALLLSLLFGVMAFLYALSSQFVSAKSRDYRWRRWMDGKAGLCLVLAVSCAVGGTLPYVYEHTADWVKAALPAIGGIAGIAMALMKFLRPDPEKKSLLDQPWLVTLGALLLLYGQLWIAYFLARAFFPLARPDSGPYAALYAIAGITLFFSLVANLNHLNLHRFYRDRLLEAFLPEWKSVAGGRTEASVKGDEAPLSGMALAGVGAPYPLINTNLVLVDSRELTWQERGGDNYVLSPFYCGSGATGWRRTAEVLGDQLSLATAMATSGAAANPDAVGVTRNRLVALLMSVLNLRLGFWLPHPRNRWQWTRPNHVVPGLSQVIHKGGLGYHERAKFVHLSDGGHFENLALYELVRRKARLIVLCDGAADPDFKFEDFQNLGRLAAIDFGASIVFPAEGGLARLPPREPLAWPPAVKAAPTGFVVGTIHYADGSQGTLIYVKSTVIDGLPPEVLGYAARDTQFPHQTTADQWFDEDQFEAYRQLGHHLGTRMAAEARLKERLEAL